MSIAACHVLSPKALRRAPQPADPLGAFLHALLTVKNPFAPGGLRLTATATGIIFAPGCCTGLNRRRGWLDVMDGDGQRQAFFGHDPLRLAERHGDTVRLTVDGDRADSPTTDLPVADLRRLLADTEHDFAGFFRLTAI
ncbi:hypothetical protein OU787_08700 [Kitasatospora sp. YST-16]|uniref:hypothetical protein n=1 Tax=Kitasatospora sp. YST-16 TaxID=2998080 RepID=UPI002284F433|nr:hypothetical protein [Kitasatospora sp. YST-16]WAL71577.1 hypothetical protein OU787_08700 [Kitasatospora sp. YST-16]WNW37617.1 hypothetical protein RKE32_08650 [Streptomyces sp. Li-HN-5-13]